MQRYKMFLISNNKNELISNFSILIVDLSGF
jgi:hypothetical protein